MRGWEGLRGDLSTRPFLMVVNQEKVFYFFKLVRHNWYIRRLIIQFYAYSYALRLLNTDTHYSIAIDFSN